MSSPATKSRKQGLDEDSFQQLLAAAFVVQQHNEQHKTSTDDKQESAKVEVHPDAVSDTPVGPRPAFAFVMEEIVATQHQIQTRRLETQQAMDLIVERLLPIAHADGVAIALLEQDGREIEYRAAIGQSSRMAGHRVRTEEALCAESVRNATTLQCPDTAEDFRLDPKICADRKAAGLIAVPVYRDEMVAGALELVFVKPDSFLDHDVRTCQLMAGMVTEALDRAADVEVKQALVNERATMLAALEKLKPQLERIVEIPAAPALPEDINNRPSTCSACGATFGQKDVKCVHCGLARDSRVGQDTQSKLASMVRNSGADLTVARDKPDPDARHTNRQNSTSSPTSNLLKAPPRSMDPPTPPDIDTTLDDATPDDATPGEDDLEIPSSIIDDLEAKMREYDPDRLVPAPGIASAESNTNPIAETETRLESATVPLAQIEEPIVEESLASETPEEFTPGEMGETQLRITPAPVSEDAWTSASNARQWLESITNPESRTALARFINHYRGEIYLGAAVLVVGFAVWWSVWGGGPSWRDLRNSSNPTTTADASAATRRRPKPQEPELSMYEKILISLGLAEAPPAPVYLGNPDVKVWVDLQTALYYCPAAELYGNTPKGKFTTQKDAQLDQFEPAYRRACD